MLKPGDNVRILAGQNRGKTGVYVREYRGRAVVLYGPSCKHKSVVKFESIEKVER